MWAFGSLEPTDHPLDTADGETWINNGVAAQVAEPQRAGEAVAVG
jgi:hypothetical protein